MKDITLKGTKLELFIPKTEEDNFIRVLYNFCIDNKINASLIIKENGTKEN